MTSALDLQGNSFGVFLPLFQPDIWNGKVVKRGRESEDLPELKNPADSRTDGEGAGS